MDTNNDVLTLAAFLSESPALIEAALAEQAERSQGELWADLRRELAGLLAQLPAAAAGHVVKKWIAVEMDPMLAMAALVGDVRKAVERYQHSKAGRSRRAADRWGCYEQL